MRTKQQYIDFETKIAYLEQTIESLDKMVYLQDKEINELKKTVQSLVKKFIELSNAHESNSSKGLAHERPPHY